MGPDGRPSAALRRRMARAAALAKHLSESPVILTGGHTGGPVSEARAMAGLAEEMGLATERLVLEEQARDTLGNARHSLPLIAGKHLDTVFVVTEPYHLPRALLSFRLLAPRGIRIRGVAAAWPAPAPALLACLREGVALPVYLARVLRARASFRATRTSPEP